MKTKTVFICNQCGYESAKWFGKCPGCSEWNTMTEEVEKVSTSSSKSSRTQKPFQKPKNICEAEFSSEDRTSTGIAELDRVLGGGLVDGSVILLGGDPGIGKSTILLQMASAIDKKKSVLYVSGEESGGQIKMRAKRLNSLSPNLMTLCETSLDNIILAVNDVTPDILIIDSIQTMYKEELSSSAGSVSQVKECAMELMQVAKANGMIVILVGHVTKDGAIAGPRVLEHMVDCVLYFEGDRNLSFRILRAVKNRFGSTNEIGVFEMRSQGLFAVENPSMMLLSGRPLNVSGTCICCCMEGSRPVMSEVQALVCNTSFGTPRRMCTGFDYLRVSMLIAVLEKRCGIIMSTQDAYINVIGGLKIDDPGADIAVALSLASSFRDRPLPDDFIAIGEIGLAGEIRAVSSINSRVGEAIKLGFRKIIVPYHNELADDMCKGAEIYRVKSVAQAISLML